MNLCVKHGMFSLNFIKNTLGDKKIRNLMGSLFNDGYEAAKGTKVLIGTTMSLVGSHVAEALCMCPVNDYFKAVMLTANLFLPNSGSVHRDLHHACLQEF